MTSSPTMETAADTHGPGLSTAGLITVLAGAALAPIDLFVVNVALPSIQAGLAASAATLEWVVTAYGLGFALMLVAGGRLGDAFGRRRLFLVGLAGFTLTSLACGLAPTALVLVIARAAQGVSAAMLVPQALSIIQTTTGGPRRARAIGYYGATGGLSMVVGQLAGGLLVSADLAGATWRPVFLVNVPIGVVALVAARFTVPEGRSSRPSTVDVTGTVLLALGLLMLLVPLMEGPGLGWPLWCWLLLAGSPVALAGFVRVERRRERRGTTPLLPSSVLGVPAVRLGLGVVGPFFVVHGGFLFVWALVLQNELHLDPWLAGVALAPLGTAFLVLALSASRLVERFGPRVVGAGGVLVALGLVALGTAFLLSWPRVGPGVLVPGVVVLGVGLGAVSPTVFRVVLAGVPVETAGAGSGVLATTQQVSTALGVATLGTLFTALQPRGALAAVVVVLAVAAVLAVTMALVSLRLPDPRR